METLLSSLGIDGVVIDDETEFQDFLENNHQYWDYVDEGLEKKMQGASRVTFYLAADEEGFAKMGEVRIALQSLKESRSDCGSLLLTLENLQDADWENNWKQYYKPMEIGERLLVIPQWEKAACAVLRHQQVKFHLPLEHHHDVAAAEQEVAHGVAALHLGSHLHGLLPVAGANL